MIARSFALAGLLAALPAASGPTGDPTLAHADDPVSALQAVRIVGTVTDAGTGAGLADVQVFIPGSGIGALTRQQGAYSLPLADAWAGTEVTVRFERIGLTPETRTLVLAAGDNTVDVAMSTQTLGLDELVVTGTAGAARRREVGMAGAYSVAPHPSALPDHHPDFNTEAYAHIEENRFVAVGTNPLSTFSIDVDRASYSNVRRFIRDGRRPPVDAVRIEELINYFPYADPAPDGEVPFSVTTELTPAPWQPLHKLVRIGLKAREVATEDLPPNNLVFLLDVSGSMRSPDKLPLVKTAMRLLVEQLRPEDRVAIAVYAGAAGLVLESTPGSEKSTILDAIGRLEAGGSTAGGAGIKLAYQVAAESHLEDGNNRVILATDGDFNVGASSDSEMIRLIEEKRAQGTYLTVLGFGSGNLKDSKMEQLADHGNGNFAYIDGELEAKKALVTEMGGTLLTVAQDVKIQVEFNPARVAAYRLIGYENRLLADEDFTDDTKDAGEIGAGHSVVALYEVVPVGVETPVDVGSVDPLRYQAVGPDADTQATDELMFVKLRYKQPGAAESTEISEPVTDVTRGASADLRFAAAVAAWGMLLRDSELVGDFSLAEVAALARASLGEDREGYRAEFVELVDRSITLELLANRP